jgi:hypothetical protein
LRKDVEEADRKSEVRAAARAWHRAGAIERQVMEAIFSDYADDRSRVGAPFRILLFVFTLLATGAAFGLLAVNDLPMGGLLFLTACGCIVLTEIQIGELRRSSAGAEEATALLALGFTYAFLVWTFEESQGDLPWRFLFLATAVLAGAAAFRWGISLFGAISAICLFAALVSWPYSRLAWILLGAALAPPLAVASVAPALAPSHRRAADATLMVSLAATYVAVHLGSYDFGLLEDASRLFGLYSPASESPGPWGRPFFIGATALLPLVVLSSGIRWRRPLLLRMGLLLGIASLVTLRFYVHIAPLWVILAASGALAIGAGLLLERWLREGPASERHGFTAEPLFGAGSATGALEVGLSAALAPEARASSPGEPGFRGGGGKFGGGGAAGSY